MPEDFTQLLQRATRGESDAEDARLPAVYAELRRLAAGCLRRERPDHTLQATSLVHEVYLRMVDQTDSTRQNRTHFFAIAARFMRRVLVDHARKRGAVKRKGHRTDLTLERIPDEHGAEPIILLELDEALVKLEKLDARKSRVVELRYFAGMEMADVASALGVSKRSVESDWYFARAWLRGELT